MTSEQIARINALAARKRDSVITPEEMEELSQLRQQYILEFRGNLKSQLDSVYIQQEDGSYRKLEKKDEPGKENHS